MGTAANNIKTDKLVVVIASLSILAISLFLQYEFNIKQALYFLLGIVLGVTLMHAAFGFTGGWRKFIRERHSVGIRAQILLLIFSSILFFPVVGNVLADVFPDLNTSAALAPVGVSVLVGAFLFGIGMQLGGGCGSGTLFTVGQGQTDMLITLGFFIVGATLGSYHLDWWMTLPSIGTVSLISKLGWLPGLVLQLSVLIILYRFVSVVEKKRHQSLQDFSVKRKPETFLDQLIFGPWPAWWAVIGLTLFGFVTLLLAGYPWSITFAFGLWGAKIWTALGGDAANWAYWSSGYPAKALNQSVLADITSVMNFGIVIGAMLAAALAGKYAPAGKLKSKRVLTAVIGGLLLGYGARLAFGCNIGALLGGIASGSLHGWLWLVMAFIGGIVGVKIRVWMKFDKPYGKAA
ncbi:MAG: YeeE/YedE family protein [Gammaproteobacteria bacterium]|nr:YeeE/YedE family protein [Gammaproteobacteria bacterium]